MAVTTDVVRCIWHDNEGVALDVGPDADALGLVWLRNHDAKSVEYFGTVNVSFAPDIARAIGVAMITAANEAEAPQ